MPKIYNYCFATTQQKGGGLYSAVDKIHDTLKTRPRISRFEKDLLNLEGRYIYENENSERISLAAASQRQIVVILFHFSPSGKVCDDAKKKS